MDNIQRPMIRINPLTGEYFVDEHPPAEPNVVPNKKCPFLKITHYFCYNSESCSMKDAQYAEEIFQDCLLSDCKLYNSDTDTCGRR